jgi:hypothetical protein
MQIAANLKLGDELKASEKKLAVSKYNYEVSKGIL